MAQVKARELVKSYEVGEVPHPIQQDDRLLALLQLQLDSS